MEKEFVATLDCNGLGKQVNIKALTVEEATRIVQRMFPDCKLESIYEYLKS